MMEGSYERIAIHSQGRKEVGWDSLLQSISDLIRKISISVPVPFNAEEKLDGLKSSCK